MPILGLVLRVNRVNNDNTLGTNLFGDSERRRLVFELVRNHYREFGTNYLVEKVCE